jgi:large subunit ribosomal protein L23
MTAAKKYNMDQLMTVVLAPVVSEKSTMADKNRQYVFRVADAATKPEIKAAVELMFKTKVESVTVLNVHGKTGKRFGKQFGRRRNWKKAYVRLAEGQEINFAATE